MNDVAVVREKNGLQPSGAYARRTLAHLVDVFENGDELLIVADVPGVPSDGIGLRVVNDTLILEARRAHANPQPFALAREFEEADFAATFRIPPGIDGGAITAEAKGGTLLVRLPKGAAAKPRKIAVRSAD